MAGTTDAGGPIAASALGDTLDASAQFQLALELGQVGLWRHDLATGRMHYNDHTLAMLGLHVGPSGMSIDELRSHIHPDDLPQVVDAARKALDSDSVTEIVARHRSIDGQWRDVLTRRIVERAPDGTPMAFAGISVDVTDQLQREREVRDLARRLEIATTAGGVGIWSRDLQTEAGEWNAQMYTIAGRSAALGAPSVVEWVEQIVHPDDRDRLRDTSSVLASIGPEMIDLEYRILRPGGEVRWLANRARRELWNGRPMIFGTTLDITERRRTELALRAADERAALAARGAGIGTWEVDLATGRDRWDDQMFVLRGLAPAAQAPSREERLALVHPDDRLRNLDTVTATLSGSGPTSYEFRVRWPDGSWHWLASRSMPITDAAGRTLRRVGVNWDITEAREAELARQQKALAERESRAKSQFLARMSHELRTPLNAVLGFTQLLQMEPASDVDAGRAAKLGHIRAAGEHLLSLINDVLDLTSLESEDLKLDVQPVALAELVVQAIALVAPLADQHAIAVQHGALEGIASADRTRLLQVLMNLLSNAVKYNRPGGEAHIETRAEGERVAIVVRDSGRGMTAEQLEHLFEPFNRLGLEYEGIEGTGIGLTIVRTLLTRMGGSIAVTSRAGTGTRVEVLLPGSVPAERLPGDVHDAVARPAAAPRCRSAQVLYIEDNAVNVMLVEEMVRSVDGLRIASAATGAEGVQRARELQPDLVLVDMQLPDFDGFEVLRRLRADPDTAGLHCVALSANAMPEDIERALRAGFADYWTKPVDMRAFIAALETMFPADANGR